MSLSQEEGTQDWSRGVGGRWTKFSQWVIVWLTGLSTTSPQLLQSLTDILAQDSSQSDPP